ncbi:unnamed protein product [Trichobilharzia regenti]|nr:unnamed protein product [Trichobilharzia regenti]
MHISETIYVPIPSIISNPLVDKSSYFLIGLNLIKWVSPLMPTSVTTKTRSQDIPLIYELIAYKLPIPHNLYSADLIKLGQWNSSQLIAHTTSESPQQQRQVYVELSQPIQDTSLRYEKGSAKRLIGKELPRSQDYALSTRVCLRVSCSACVFVCVCVCVRVCMYFDVVLCSLS